MAVPPFNQYRFNREKDSFHFGQFSGLSSSCALPMQFQIISFHLHVWKLANERQSLFRKDKLLFSIKKNQIFFDLRKEIKKINLQR